jgi:ferredoxin
MKLVIDKAQCISCGTCMALAPKTFKWDAESKAEAIDPPGDTEADVKSAVEACPVQCIKME